ncbi:MAG: helical backbone metal receptor [Thermoanaerobaculia bacterium]|nr:helical backbone metal receptor [Thermoanaerobaculia bacterium]
MKRSFAVAAIAAVVVGFVACGDRSTRGADPAADGRVADPQRVVALAPSVVELLYELELGDRLVGVGDYCRWPPEVEEKPKLGGLFDPHLEEISRLEPELAILLPSEEQLAAHLERIGVEVLTVPSESLDDIETAALAIARRFSVEARGEAFVEHWRAALAPRPLDREPRVLLAVSRSRGTLTDMLSAGPQTFYHELLVRLGAINVFSDAEALYPQVSLEEVMQRLPEAVIELRSEEATPAVRRALRDDWRMMDGVPAFERGCYDVIGGDYVMLPGPRLPRLYDELRAALEACGY